VLLPDHQPRPSYPPLGRVYWGGALYVAPVTSGIRGFFSDRCTAAQGNLPRLRPRGRNHCSHFGEFQYDRRQVRDCVWSCPFSPKGQALAQFFQTQSDQTGLLHRIYAGYGGTIRIFDTASPGRSYRTLSTKDLGPKGTTSGSSCLAQSCFLPWLDGPKRLTPSVCRPGIVSCLAFNPDYSGLVAAGSYSGRVGLYTEGERGVVSVLEGHRGGVTQVPTRLSPPRTTFVNAE
jgi:WD40 repeat protein